MLNGVLREVFVALVPTVLGIVGYVALRIFWLRKKRRFFGLRRGSVRLMLSNVQVETGRTHGVTQVQEGFQGTAIALGEYEAALGLVREIEEAPVLRRLRERDVVTSDDVPQSGVCEIEVSPRAKRVRPDYAPSGVWTELDEAVAVDADDDEMADVLFQKNVDTIILVGSSVYNSLTEYMLARAESTKTFFRFFRDDNGRRGIVDLGVKPPNAYYRRKEEGRRCEEYFLIQRTRLRDPHSAETKTVFVCAGTGTRATMCAVDRLQTKWAEFAKAAGDSDFASLYRLETNDPEHKSRLSKHSDDAGNGPIRSYPLGP